MYKECKVVMLPTKEKAKSHLFIGTNRTELTSSSGIGNHALYITSDDEIKGGDYFINMKSNTIFKCIEPFKKYEHIDNRLLLKSITVNENKQFLLIDGDAIPKKIIATTDKSLMVLYKYVGEQEGYSLPLVQPTVEFVQHYITEYNKGNIITDVEVEYTTLHTHSKQFGDDTLKPQILNVDNNNCITIKKKENKLYTTSDVENILFKFAEENGLTSSKSEINDFNVFVKENLE